MENYSPKIWEPIDFKVYFSFVKWPLLAGLILEIALRFFTNSWENQELETWILRVAIFAFLGWRSVKNFGLSVPVSALAGAICGFGLGFIIACLRFLGGAAVWKFFNILTETALTAAVGALIAVLMVYLFSFRK